MRLVILIIFLSVTHNTIAQNNYSNVKRCGADNFVANKILNDSNYLKIVEQTRLGREEVANRSYKNTQACPNGNVVIPVAIHFDNGIGTTAQEQTCLISLANAQIRALNKAYNGLDDEGCSTSPSGGACIIFKIANRNHVASSGLQNGEPAITFNGAYTCPFANPCNVTGWGGYLNIVVQNMIDFEGPLGIAPLNGNPGGGGAENSFLVDACTFGTDDVYCSQAGPNSCATTFRYRSGFTAVHEAGHFYGLDHTFCTDGGGNPEGGESCNCGSTNCDGFTDTPPQCYSNYSCFSGTCSQSVSNPCGGTAVFNNFMDYLVDDCMNSFSDQQTIFMNQLANAEIYKQSALGDFTPTCDFLLKVEGGSRYANENESIKICSNSEFIIEEIVLNNPESYNWTFATTNGLQVNIGSSINPSPVLRLSGTAGQLTISLTASNSSGNCSSTSKTFNVAPSLELTANLNSVTCLNNNFAEVELNVGSTIGNVSFSPANLVTGSGTNANPYLTLVNLDGDCSPIALTAFDDGLTVEKGIFEILQPFYLTGNYEVGINNASDFGVDIETILPCVQGEIIIVNDGNGATADFCQPSPPAQPNTSQCNNLNGNIALVDRGICTFTSKIENAQACGAIAVVICNCEPFTTDCTATSATEVVTMTGSSNIVNIPSIFISYNDCQLIKSALNQEPVRACIGAPRSDLCAQTITINPCEITACSSNGVSGCTNPCAANYNPQATQENGSCTNITTASISGLPAFIANGNSIQLTGSPAGGTFSGNGIVFTSFNPSLVNFGLHPITYTYNNGNGCQVSTSQTILVSQINYNFVQYQLDFISP